MKKKLFKISTFLVILVLTTTVWSGNSISRASSEEDLERQLKEIERQIAEQEQILSGITGERQAMQDLLKKLQAQQNRLRLQIQATNLQINDLDSQINNTQNTISATNAKLEEYKPQLAETLRQINERDRHSLVMVMFNYDTLSEAVNELESFSKISDNLTVLINESKKLRGKLEDEQEKFEQQQNEAKHLMAIQSLQQREHYLQVQQQDNVLSAVRSEEEEYKAILAQTRQQAASIRARIFDLAGGMQTEVTFGEAVEIAQWVQGLTGVRAAFLLAILTQESNLGKNVGQCNIIDNTSGNSQHVSTGRIYQRGIHPTRDLPKLIQIAEELGLDVYQTPISCTLIRSGREIGYGGAMGPAQFIPSTWLGYRDRVSALLEVSANPWNIRHAFLASGVLLGANGADRGTQAAELEAALRYFAGGNWQNPAYRFYGQSVLNLANRYQAELDGIQ